MKRWRDCAFGDVVSARGSGTSGLPQSEWMERGQHPVIGQGASYIEGWSDRADLLVTPSPAVVLYGGHTRRAKYVDFSFVPGPNVKILEPSQDLDAKFLYRFLEQLQVESRGYADHFPEVRRCRVPIPPLDVQRRIAAILDQADALRAKRRTALAHLDALAHSIFLDMFGDPVANPKGWPLMPLRALGRVVTGTTPPSEREGMFNGPIPFVTPGDLESGQPPKRTVTEEGAKESRTVGAGALLVCCIGATIGKMGRADTRSAFNQQINAVDWGDLVLPDFGLAAMRFFKKTIAALGSSTTLPILKKSSFEQLALPVPPIDEQRELVRRVRAIGGVKAEQVVSLRQLDTLFATLQNKAFSGAL